MSKIFIQNRSDPICPRSSFRGSAKSELDLEISRTRSVWSPRRFAKGSYVTFVTVEERTRSVQRSARRRRERARVLHRGTSYRCE